MGALQDSLTAGIGRRAGEHELAERVIKHLEGSGSTWTSKLERYASASPHSTPD